MRIIYSITGEGRGHASRLLTLLPHLDAEFLILAGDDSYDYLTKNMRNGQALEHKILPVPTLKYAYNTARINQLRTLAYNIPKVFDFKTHGLNMMLGQPFSTATARVQKLVDDFKPDLIISDGDQFVNHVRRNAPLIAIDRYSKIAFCRFDIEAPRSYRWVRGVNAFTYRAMLGNPDYVIATSFYDAQPLTKYEKQVYSTGPIFRKAVLDAQPEEGEHVLVYATNPYIYTDVFLKALEGLERQVIVYGNRTEGSRGNVVFKHLDPVDFIEDVRTCNYCISTPGNMLLGELGYFQKRALLFETDSLEQQENILFASREGWAKGIDACAVSSEEIATSVEALTRPTGFRDHKQEILDRVNELV